MSAHLELIVGGRDDRRRGKPSPESALKRAFRAEVRAQRQLLDARIDLADARRSYAAKHGLQMLPSLDTLRRLFGCRP